MPSPLLRNAALAALTSLTVVGATACAGNSPEDVGPRTDATGITQPPDGHATWTYRGPHGPAHWAELAPSFRTCAAGERQSPINLGGADEQDAPAPEPLSFDYRPVTAELVNTGHTIQANLSPGSRITLGAHRYALTQFHFHVPSEHTLRGAHAAMELHFVHADADGGLAVVAVLLAPGAGRSALAEVLSELPDRTGATRRVAGQVDPTTFLPAERDRYEYRGSLTTPPCTEGVRWAVLVAPSPVALDEVSAYRKLFPKSNRPTQARRGRQVWVAAD